MAAEKEIASLRGVHYEENMIPQNLIPAAAPTVPLAPFDSPVHDALIRASMQASDFAKHCCLDAHTIVREMKQRLSSFWDRVRILITQIS